MGKKRKTKQSGLEIDLRKAVILSFCLFLLLLRQLDGCRVVRLGNYVSVSSPFQVVLLLSVVQSCSYLYIPSGGIQWSQKEWPRIWLEGSRNCCSLGSLETAHLPLH